ncbi:MAG: signal peptidase I [Oscillospiraceae bacterium]|nr:signal peptidase I [Oscillospiraceae bacterium]
MIKKILKIAGVIVLVLILLLSVMIALGALLRDESLLSPWGTGFFIIASGSMEPNIPVGSIVYVRAVEPDQIKVDDVITFFIGNKTIVLTHRVTAITENEGSYLYMTRGDANNANDRPFGYDMVIGRVTFVIPGNGFLVSMIGNVKYIGIGVIAIGLLLCVVGIIKSSKKSKVLVAAGDSEDGDSNLIEMDDTKVGADSEETYKGRMGEGEDSARQDEALDEIIEEVDSNEITFYNDEDK